MIKSILMDLDIKPSMLAALLEITTETLRSWQVSDRITRDTSCVYYRLERLFEALCVAKKSPIPKYQLFNFFHQPITPSGSSLFYFIVDESNKDHFAQALQVAIADYLSD